MRVLLDLPDLLLSSFLIQFFFLPQATLSLYLLFLLMTIFLTRFLTAEFSSRLYFFLVLVNDVVLLVSNFNFLFLEDDDDEDDAPELEVQKGRS